MIHVEVKYSNRAFLIGGIKGLPPRLRNGTCFGFARLLTFDSRSVDRSRLSAPNDI